MADLKDFLEFDQRGVGMFFDVGVELGRVKFTPGTPTGFGGQGAGLGGGEVAVNRARRHPEAPGRLGFGAASADKLHHPLPQIQRVGFHAHTLSTYLPM